METMNAMKRGKDILKGIHGNLCVKLSDYRNAVR
jgi:hypothetical protein